jgi:hypothetical protein
VVEDPTSAHILAKDGDGGRDGLAGVVIEGFVVGVDCLILEPAIGKMMKNRKQYIQKVTQYSLVCQACLVCIAC